MSPELAVMEDSSRAERRLQALLALDHDQEGLRNMDWGSRGPQSTGDAVLGIERLSVLDEEPLNVSHGPKAVANGVSGHASISPKGSVSHDGDFWNGADNPVLMPKAPSIHPQVSSLYSRASSLLLDAMDADGVLFLSAPRDTTRQNSRRSSCISLGEMDGTPKTAGVRRRSSSLSSAAEWDEKLCHQLSSASTVACRSSTKSSCALTQGSLHGLIDLFPHGEIFNSVQAANASNMSQIESASTMRQSFPDAQSLLFLPVWDWDKSKWASVAIIWAHQNQFRECDLRYLRTFSQAIVSKLVQVGRKTVQKAKDDLLASLSHELRSPLHGMLANSELLRSTSLDSTQRDMVKMIQTCGSTLLDTMNHLLNFAKINNLSNANNVSIDNAAQIEGMMTHFDLDDIIEDLTECLYAGYRSPSELSDMSCRPEKNGGDLGNAKHVKITQDLAVVIRIENRRSWRICGIPGAWRRIIMNIVGNALKFTRTGLIEITLDWASRSQRNSKSSDVRITVTDTGCGISPEYLQEKLFIPFSQEHILTEGVGLGLSISRQLLAKLGGIIDIKSEVDVGTQVDIQIPVEFLEQEQTADGLDSRNGEMKVPKRVCLVGYESNTEDEGSIKAKRKLAIRDAVRSAVQHQKGFKVSTAQSLSDGPGDIAVIEESTLHELASNGPVQSVFSSVVVLGAHASALRGSGFNGSINVVNVPQPIGTRKILQAIQTLDKLHPRGASNRRDRHPVLSDSIKIDPLSAALEKPEAVNSPPVARESVSEYTASTPKPPEERFHVLVVDDSNINVKVLSTFMDKIGCTYDTAENGLIALEKYKDSPQRFDFVLMDISMPIMDGVTATSKIREYEDERSLQPSNIMAVTGVASNEMQQQAFAAGVDEYLVKPLSLQDLKRIMGVP